MITFLKAANNNQDKIMISFGENHKSAQGAKELDKQDSLHSFRNRFNFPLNEKGEKILYFTGHSLGLMPKLAQEYIQEELNAWKAFAVEGHFNGKHPWMTYQEGLSEAFTEVVGAHSSEIAIMNTLTVNLHLMLVSFYRPTKKRFKILIENNTFPSDKYAVDSQARFHGYDPKEAIVELKPSSDGMTVSEDSLIEQITEHGDELALVMLGNCNYLSGQYFDIPKVVQAAKEVGAFIGFNLAHGAGNLILDLHKDEADFAVWCTYKYLNAGPGALAGAFIHQKYHKDKTIPRLEGWYGNHKSSRFKMRPEFESSGSADSWILSNPPIISMAPIRASMELVNEAGFKNLRKKGDALTCYMEWLLKEECGETVTIVTPAYNSEKQTRGSMLCLKMGERAKEIGDALKANGAIVDFREPDILRMAPAPLYNSFEDVYELIQIIKQTLS